jgi:hypothetical protein
VTAARKNAAAAPLRAATAFIRVEHRPFSRAQARDCGKD